MGLLPSQTTDPQPHVQAAQGSEPSDTYISKLAALASQHHKSAYCQIKFGPKGSSIPYVPFSVTAPELYAELLLNPSYSWHLKDTSIETSTNQDPPSSNLEEDLNDAMSEQLVVQNSPPHPNPIKNSLSHPINVSHIIPLRMMPIIASHALLSTRKEIPTIFTVPPSYTLDRLISYEIEASQAGSFPDSLSPPHPSSPASSPPSLINFCDPQEPNSQTRVAVSEAIRMAVESEVPGLPPPPPFKSEWSHPHTFYSQNDSNQPHASTMSLPIIENPPGDVAPIPGLDHEAITKRIGPSPIVHELDASSLLHSPLDSPADKFTVPPVTYFDASTSSSSLNIGNLLLSSCPGKKVRLHGPTRGRPPISRDLETDLARIKDFGVGCIVCCLDDSELDFLGAPWSEYSAAAKRMGFDQLRIPTPEGIAPFALSPATLDDLLSRLIEEYTLHNISILVHCRGGVGRAGVIACCWLLKLGLSGSLRCVPSIATEIQPANEEVLQLVETVINVVRKRRSVKAIETFEQVRFLVDYANYLRSHPHRLCSELDEIQSS